MKTTFQNKQIEWFFTALWRLKVVEKLKRKYYGPENGKIVKPQFSCNFTGA